MLKILSNIYVWQTSVLHDMRSRLKTHNPHTFSTSNSTKTRQLTVALLALAAATEEEKVVSAFWRSSWRRRWWRGPPPGCTIGYRRLRDSSFTVVRAPLPLRYSCSCHIPFSWNQYKGINSRWCKILQSRRFMPKYGSKKALDCSDMVPVKSGKNDTIRKGCLS